MHIEFVYGRLSILKKRSNNIGGATLGLLAIFVSMLLLSVLRTNFSRGQRERGRTSVSPATPEQVKTTAV